MFKLNCCLLSFVILFNSALAWTGFEPLGGGLSHVASASWGPGRIDVIGAAPDGSVWLKTFSKDAWSGWSGLGGNTKLKPGAYSIKSNWIDIIYTGTDQFLYRKTWNGKTWIDWKRSSNGGLFISGPTLTAVPSATTGLHVFAVGTDKALYHCVVDISDNQWTWWENLGKVAGGLVGDPAAVSWSPTRFDIFSIASDSQLYQKTYDNGWKEWQVLSGGAFNPGVGAASKGPGLINVFMKGKDDAVYTRSYASNRWNTIDKVGGGMVSSPSAVSTSVTRVDVFIIGGSDRQAYRSYWDSRTDVDPKTHGCHKGKCWTRCSTTFIDIISNEEWCYTTKGKSQDFNYILCETSNSCERSWACAGSCTV